MQSDHAEEGTQDGDVMLHWQFFGEDGVLGVDLCACIKTIILNCGSTSLVVAIGTIL